VSRATEVYSREFDSIIFKLAPPVRELIETKIHDLGIAAGEYPHHRLQHARKGGPLWAAERKTTKI
jgi:hypothetical protein